MYYRGINCEYKRKILRGVEVTTNIIMNIFIPNVIMVFVAAISEYLEWTELTKRVYLFVVFLRLLA